MTTNSLVLELQREAIKSNCVVSDLVRNAYFIAKKLNIPDIQEWLTHELNGYPLTREIIPGYRVISLYIKGKTLLGWMPVIIEEKYNELEKFYCIWSMAEIEKNILSHNNFINIKPPPQHYEILCHIIGMQIEFNSVFSTSRLSKITEQVKTKILDWAIELENRGILGENLMFTEDEKHKANTIINNHFHGDVNQSQIQQNTTHSTQNQSVNEINIDLAKVQELVDEINNLSSNIKFTNISQSDDFNSKLCIINEELRSESPNRGNIKSTILAIKSILEKVSVSVISTGIIHSINSLF